VTQVVGADPCRQARVIDQRSGVDPGAGLAALSKELRAVMAAGVPNAAVAADPPDELKARRDAKRSWAGNHAVN
jgi:hypothetical protein